MKLKKWENPNLTSLNLSETKNDTFHFPTAWHCPTCGPITATFDKNAGFYKCDGCGIELNRDHWVGDGPHPS